MSAYHCDEDEIPHKKTLTTIHAIQSPEDSSAGIFWQSASKKELCPIIAGIKVGHKTQGYTIDWTKVFLIVNGYAQSVLPGYTKGNVSSLKQRPSVGPPGTNIVETFILSTLIDGSLDVCPYSIKPDTLNEYVFRMPINLDNGEQILIEQKMEFEYVDLTQEERADYLRASALQKTLEPSFAIVKGYKPPYIGTLIGTGACLGLGACLILSSPMAKDPSSIPQILPCIGCFNSPLPLLGLVADGINLKFHEEYIKAKKHQKAFSDLREKYSKSQKEKISPNPETPPIYY